MWQLKTWEKSLLTVSIVVCLTSLVSFGLDPEWVIDFISSGKIEKKVGVLKSSEGLIRRKRLSRLEFSKFSNRRVIYNGDTVVTGDESTAFIQLNDGSKINMNSNSLVRVLVADDESTLKTNTVEVKYGEVTVTALKQNVTLKSGGKTTLVGSGKAQQITNGKPTEPLKNTFADAQFLKLESINGSTYSFVSKMRTIKIPYTTSSVRKIEWKIVNNKGQDVSKSALVTDNGKEIELRFLGNGKYQIEAWNPDRKLEPLAKSNFKMVLNHPSFLSVAKKEIDLHQLIYEGSRTLASTDKKVEISWDKIEAARSYEVFLFEDLTSPSFKRFTTSDTHLSVSLGQLLKKNFKRDQYYQVKAELEDGEKITSKRTKISFTDYSPKLVFPAQNGVILLSQLKKKNRGIIFSWQRNSKDKSVHEILVSRDPAFTKPVLRNRPGINFYFHPPLPNGTYYWKVIRHIGQIDGPESEVYKFEARP